MFEHLPYKKVLLVNSEEVRDYSYDGPKQAWCYEHCNDPWECHFELLGVDGEVGSASLNFKFQVSFFFASEEDLMMFVLSL